MAVTAAELRQDLEPFACVRGPTTVGGGLHALVRSGDLDVALEVGPDRRALASCATSVTGLYVDVALSPLAQLDLRSSDLPYAQALVAAVASRLGRVIASGGSARLSFGRWQVRTAGAPLRDLVAVTAALARRPEDLATAWAELAAGLGATWRGRWGTRGETAFVVPTTARAATVEVRLVAAEDGSERVHTLVLGPGRRADRRPGVVTDPQVIAAAIRSVTGADLAIGPPRVRAVTTRPAPAPMPFADWPATRAPGFVESGGGRGRAGPPLGAAPARGLRDEVDVDGVAVATTCADDARVATEVAARAPGTGPLALSARPGYRFLRGLFVPEPRLGDAGFDDRYVLDTNDLAWARWWFGASERDAIAATFHPEAAQPFGFALADQRVCFAAAAAPARAFVDAARHAAAFLARRGDRAADEWRRLAATLGASVVGARFEVEGGMIARTGRGAATIEVTTAVRDQRLVTVARAGAPAPAHAPSLWLRADRVAEPLTPTRGPGEVALDGPDDHSARTTDPSWARARIAAIAPVLPAARPELVEVVGARVRVTWAGPLLDARRLAAGIDLVARATRHGAIAAAPYR